MAAVYLLCGVPGAYSLWYRRLYSACKNDSALSYLWFFVVYLGHIAFCLYAFIGMTGTVFPRRRVQHVPGDGEPGAVGGVYAFGTALFGVDMVLSVYALRMVYARFRGGGHTIQDARNEAVRERSRRRRQRRVKDARTNGRRRARHVVLPSLILSRHPCV